MFETKVMKAQIKQFFPICDAPYLGHNKINLINIFTNSFSLKYIILFKINKSSAEKLEHKVSGKFINLLTA